VAKHLKNVIKSIAEKYKNIILCSTNISEIEYNEMSKYIKIIKVENIGYDFWSYKIGLESILTDDKNIEKVIILNSSVIYLDPTIVGNIAAIDDGFIGVRALTISHEYKRHAQSFFVSFEGKELIRSEEFKDWWKNLIPIPDRQEVIFKYEIGMSEYFVNKGYEIKSVFEPTNKEKFIALSRAIGNGYLKIGMNTNDSKISMDIGGEYPINPTHYFWDSLISKYGTIKIELLKYNNTNQNLKPFLENIKKTEPYIHELIEDALS